MCEEERNTLHLLLIENMNQSYIFKDKNNPILQSLDHGVKKAEKRLQDCEYKQCMSQFYDGTQSPKKFDLQLIKEKYDLFKKCLSFI